MKPEEALKKLKKLVKRTNAKNKNYIDLEKPHGEADRILIDLIRELLRERKQKDLGERITNYFDKIKKWYA